MADDADAAAADQSRGRPPGRETLAGELRVAVDEHWSSLGFSTGLFAVGALLGVGLYLSGFDLFAAMGFDDPSGLFPETITAVTILLNNTRAFVVVLAGVFSLGLLTAFGLLFNGVLLGYVGALAAANRGIAFVVVGIAPHGVLELPAIFVAAAVSFQVLYRVGKRVFGDRESVLTRGEWRRTALLVVAGWVVLVVAAFVEFYVTGALLDALF